MKSELVEYINGERNVVRDEFIIGRERSKNSEYIVVGIPGYEEPLYALFNSLKNRRKFKVNKDEIATIEEELPRGTGGKPAYVMLMSNVFDVVDMLSADACGLLMKLIPCVEWNTSRLIRQRDKKPLTQKMMRRQFRIYDKKLKSLLRELQKHKLIYYNSKARAYYMDNDLIRKGLKV